MLFRFVMTLPLSNDGGYFVELVAVSLPHVSEKIRTI